MKKQKRKKPKTFIKKPPFLAHKAEQEAAEALDKMFKQVQVVIFLLMCSPLFAGDIFVSHETGASDNEGDGTTGNPYRTLQKAFDVAGAGDVVKLKNDANGTTSQAKYEFNMELTNLAGTWSTTFHGYQPDVDQDWGNNDHDQKVMFLKDDAALDVYGYVIDATTITSRGFLNCTAGEVLGREPDNSATLTLIGVGDQWAAVPITTGGTTSSYMEITSGQAANAIVDLEDIEVVRDDGTTEGAFDVRAGGVKFHRLTFEDAASPADRNYAILADDRSSATAVYDGVWITNCTFTTIATGVHLSPIDSDGSLTYTNVLVENNTFTSNDFTQHTVKVILGHCDGVVRHNTFTGNAGQIAITANNGFIVFEESTGSIYGNTIKDVDWNLISGWGAGIAVTDSTLVEISHNTIENLTFSASETQGGAIMLGNSVNPGTVNNMFNNLISNCTYGFLSNGNNGSAPNNDYNCLFNSGTADYTGTGIQVGPHDIAVDPEYFGTTLEPTNPLVLRGGKPDVDGNATVIGGVERYYPVTNFRSRYRTRYRQERN